MKAVILAAGIGSRLRPMTDSKPKTMVEVNNKPMLDYLIDNLQENDINEIIMCIGFKGQHIINHCTSSYPNVKFKFVENKEFDVTNNMYSLYLAKDYLDDDIILMNSDLVFESKIISGLKKQKKSSIAVEKGLYNKESMKLIVDKNGKITSISKKITESEAYGCSIDVYKINKNDLNAIKDEMYRIIVENKELNQWTEVMLDNLFKSGNISAFPYDIDGKWYEIDNYEDLAKAEILFNNNINNLKNKKIFFIDRDGTLTLNNDMIKNADNFINALKLKNKKYLVVTNNSSKTPAKHLENFNNLGLSLGIENILVSLVSALDYLKGNKLNNIFWIANSEVSSYIESKGFIYDQKKPKAILLTYDTELSYEKLVLSCHLIRKGIPYYATHLDMVCPTPYGDIPDIGTFIDVLETTTNTRPNRIFGKPNSNLIESTLEKYNLSHEDAVIIGDRLYTDIKMAENSKLTSVLVLSGETKREMYEYSSIKADVVVPSVSDLIEFIK